MRAVVLLLACLSVPLAAGEPATVPPPALTVELQPPLTTIVRLAQPLSGRETGLRATVTVPADAPTDLGVGAFVADRHGRWFQRLRPGVLPPGTHELAFAVGGDDSLVAESDRGAWSASEAGTATRAGLFFWSASGSRARLTVAGLAATAPGEAPAPAGAALLDLRLDGLGGDGRVHALTGTRWSLSVRPEPFPADPFDPAAFALDALVTAPDGSSERVPAFYEQPMRARDRGDREELRPAGPAGFRVRYRPRQPGTHRVRLEARWEGGSSVAVALPDLQVDGSPWDGFVRVDRGDPRFFSVGGRWYWPLGPNLRSVNDTRGADRLRTVFTPDRGTLAYEAYLRRLAANGVNAVEVWMSSWNLALEWRADWPGFGGQGRYHQGNAWRLDRLLDLALELGVRVNLVINNHGQASTNADPEWASNPYNRARGGRLTDAADFFSDPWALAGQDRLRRYLVARYADHPAVLGWKLWSEVNLTAGRGDQVRTWHAHAAKRWKELDPYDHPVTTHWCGDYHLPDREIVAQPSLDYVCIDAYHGNDRLLADLIWRSTLDPVPSRGLAQFNKPVLTTEFGCNWDAGPEAQMRAEHATGPWAGLMSGHAGAPMLWWFEWLDQGGHFGVYRALSRFLAGEDLRGADARSLVLAANAEAGPLWCRAWSRPGRMLGYLLDGSWGRNGRNPATHERAAIEIGTSIAPGPMTVEWWDADAGAWNRRVDFVHPGGPLALKPPAFQRHLAFKLLRSAAVPAN